MTNSQVKSIAVAAIAASVVSTAAYAQMFHFKYASSELAEPAARAAMAERLDREATGYCEQRRRQSIEFNSAVRDCQEEIVRDILAKVGDGRFSALIGDGVVVARN